MTVLTTLADAHDFLDHHPDIAGIAQVTATPEAGFTVWLRPADAAEDERLGMVYGLAATYGGELSPTAGSVGVLVRWAERKSCFVYTSRSEVAAVSK